MTLRRLLGVVLFTCVRVWSHPGPVFGQQVWRLTEDLRIGGADAGPASFAEVGDVAVDGASDIFVLDYKASEIREFDSVGRFVRTIGRVGAGPGEYGQRVHGIRTAPDGRLWVNDAEHGRLVVFDSNGSFYRQVLRRYNGFSAVWHARFDTLGRLMEVIPSVDSAGSAVLAALRLDPKTLAWSVHALPWFSDFQVSSDRNRWHYRNTSGGGTIAIPFAPQSLSVFDPAGTWWCSAATSYQVRLVDIDNGDVIASIRKKAARYDIGRSVRDSAMTAVAAIMSSVPRGTVDLDAIPKTYPPVGGLAVDDKHELWVTYETERGPKIDVWSPDGTRIAMLNAPPGTLAKWILVISQGRYYTVALDHDDVPFVVRYRIDREH